MPAGASGSNLMCILAFLRTTYVAPQTIIRGRINVSKARVASPCGACTQGILSAGRLSFCDPGASLTWHSSASLALFKWKVNTKGRMPQSTDPANQFSFSKYTPDSPRQHSDQAGIGRKEEIRRPADPGTQYVNRAIGGLNSSCPNFE